MFLAAAGGLWVWASDRTSGFPTEPAYVCTVVAGFSLYMAARARWDLRLARLHKFTIVRAEYGAEDQWIEVTADLCSKVKRRKLETLVTNALCGRDPKPGVGKILKVDYKIGSKERSESISEGSKAVLP